MLSRYPYGICLEKRKIAFPKASNFPPTIEGLHPHMEKFHRSFSS